MAELVLTELAATGLGLAELEMLGLAISELVAGGFDG